MKTIILSLAICLSTFTVAATDKTKESASNKSTSATTTTEHNFEDMLVQGKFHFSDEAVTTVEEDKVLDNTSSFVAFSLYIDSLSLSCPSLTKMETIL